MSVRVFCLFVALKRYQWKKHRLLQTSEDFLCQLLVMYLSLCKYGGITLENWIGYKLLV